MALLTALHPSLASAAIPPPSLEMAPVDSERYGKEALRDQRIEDASNYFKYAYLKDRTEARLWDLVLAEVASDQCLGALIDLRQYLSEANASTLHTADAARLIDKLYGHTGHIVFTQDARVFLNGRERGVGRGHEVDVMPGDQTIALTDDGEPRHFSAIAGQVTTIDLASILRGSGPAASLAPSRGTVARATNVSPSRSAKWPTTITIGASALAVAAGGLALNLIALQKYNDSNAQRIAMGLPDWWCTVNGGTSQCQTLRNNVSTYRTEYTASLALYGTGGALAVTATLLGILWRPSDKESSANAWVLPTLGPGMIGAVGGASF